MDLTGVTGTNDFKDGIDIFSGALKVANARQLGTPLGALGFLTKTSDFASGVTSILISAITALAVPNAATLPNSLDAFAQTVGSWRDDDGLSALIVAEDGAVTIDGQVSYAQRLVVGDDVTPMAASIHMEEGAKLTMTDSRAPIVGSPSPAGGAVSVEDASLLTLTAEAGALYSFKGNQAHHGEGDDLQGSARGGAIYNQGFMFVENALFQANHANLGGALLNEKGLAILKNTLFEENRSFDRGGAVANAIGGGMAFYGDTRFVSNSAATGGAIHADGGFIVLAGPFEFLKNTASLSGGAIAATNEADTAIVLAAGETAVFSGNRAAGAANAISLSDGSVLTVDLASGSFLDMYDPISGNSSDQAKPVKITQKGDGIWRLGGATALTASVPADHSILFGVTSGELHLLGGNETLHDAHGVAISPASITLAGENSSFSLAAGASLAVGGGNAITVQDGGIELAVGSILSFDIAKFNPVGSSDPTMGLTLSANVLDWAAGSAPNFTVDLISFHEGNYDLLTAAGALSGLDLPAAPTVNGLVPTNRMRLPLQKVGAETATMRQVSELYGDNMVLTWIGAAEDDWNIGKTNWLDSVTDPMNFMPGDQVTFGAGAGEIAVMETGVQVAGM